MSALQQVQSSARALEAECDRLLSRYAAQTQMPGPATSDIEAQLDANLAELARKVDDLLVLATTPGAPNTAHLQAVRHREILDDFKENYTRLSSVIAQARNRHDLLSSVRSDIRAHQHAVAGNEEAYYADERALIDRSDSMADTLLARAQETRAELFHQQSLLKSVQRRALQIASRVPGINTLISKVNSRQRRNSLTLVAVVVVCICVLFFAR